MVIGLLGWFGLYPPASYLDIGLGSGLGVAAGGPPFKPLKDGGGSLCAEPSYGTVLLVKATFCLGLCTRVMRSLSL